MALVEGILALRFKKLLVELLGSEAIELVVERVAVVHLLLIVILLLVQVVVVGQPRGRMRVLMMTILLLVLEIKHAVLVLLVH